VSQREIRRCSSFSELKFLTDQYVLTYITKGLGCVQGSQELGVVSLQVEEDWCNFWEEAGFWKRTSFNCREHRMETPIALSKPQHPKITESLLGAFLL